MNANKAITQIITVVSEDEKSGELKKILQLINPSGTPVDVPKTIIFVARKSTCDNLANKMWNAGFPVDSLHGDKEQFQRTKVMDLFKKSQLRILVATDVAARGLDVKDIAVIINFDFPVGPSSVEDYVHRIGRTARGDAEGKAFTFFTQSDAKSATQLIGVLERAEQQVPEELRRLDRSGGTGGNGGNGGSGGRGGRRDSQSGSGSGRGRGRGRGGGSGTKK